MRPLVIAAAFATALAAGSIVPALAHGEHGSPDCTSEPKEKWLSESAMRAKVATLGYDVKIFKTEGSCYEIYGYTKDGKNAEIYFNPVTGAVVKEEIE